MANHNLHNDIKCTCQQPPYTKIIHRLLILLIVLEISFMFANVFRLTRHYGRKLCLNDIQLRLISLLSSLFSLLFLLIIIVQYNNNRRTEPLEYFEAMRRHYSRIQIYTFSKDLEMIIHQIEKALEIRIGASYICIHIILILTLLSFLTSITVEIKFPSTLSLTFNSDNKEAKTDYYQNHHNHTETQLTPLERFMSSEQIRFTRQTKV